MRGNRISGAKHVMTDRRWDSVQWYSHAGSGDLQVKSWYWNVSYIYIKLFFLIKKKKFRGGIDKQHYCIIVIIALFQIIFTGLTLGLPLVEYNGWDFAHNELYIRYINFVKSGGFIWLSVSVSS